MSHQERQDEYQDLNPNQPLRDSRSYPESPVSISRTSTEERIDPTDWGRLDNIALDASESKQDNIPNANLEHYQSSSSTSRADNRSDTRSDAHRNLPSRPLSVATMHRTKTQIRLRRIDAGARRVFMNLPLPAKYIDMHGDPKAKFPSNKIITAKYNPISFIPKNLFEQFRRAANLYFLFMAILQLIPYFGVDSPFFTVFPISFVVAVTAIKDGYEDYQRHIVDDKFNSTICLTLRNNVNLNYPLRERVSWWRRFGRKTVNFDNSDPDTPLPVQTNEVNGPALFGATKWKNVRVGDFVLLRNGDSVPADCVILSTSEDDGTCHVETKDLDGETNLKSRRCLQITAQLHSAEDCAKIRFYVDSEPPNANLYSYNGTLVMLDHISSSPLPEYDSPSFETYFHPRSGSGLRRNPSSSIDRSSVVSTGTAYLPTSSYNEHPPTPINIDNIVLRGHVIRNTAWVLACVIFTGEETKVLLNSGETPSKRSTIEKEMNREVILNFVILAVLCAIVAVGGGLTLDKFRESQAADIFEDTTDSSGLTGFVLLWYSLIIFQNIVPISLYISIEFVKTLQAFFIANDIDMYDSTSDSTCSPKSWNLSDDLGQVEYVFSDKTGTLTRNVMEFRRCSVRGKIYGDNGFSPESEGARGARLRRLEGSSDLNGKVEQQPEDAGTDHSDSLQKRQHEFELYEKALREVFEPRYASLNKDRLTFADPEIFNDLKNAESGPSGSQGDFVKDFFTLLSVCHTVVVEHPDDENDGKDADQREHKEKYAEEPHSAKEDPYDPENSRNLDKGPTSFQLGVPEGGFARKNSTFSNLSADSGVVRADTDLSNKSGTSSNARKSKTPKSPKIHLPKLKFKKIKRPSAFTGVSAAPRRDDRDPTIHVPLLYQAESPDEAALVGAARNLGFSFLGRHGQRFIVDVLGEELEFETLAVLEFNSTRKRMSVLVRRPSPWKDVALFTKGADNVIIERLAPGQDELVQKTSEDVDIFSNEGLRTLTLAYRIMSENDYEAWRRRYDEAAASLDDREAQLDETYEEIERDLILLGATAIEDKLQEGVPDCIELLRRAGMKIWVLTGDKLETAINIGFASNLLTKDMRVSIVRGNNDDDVIRNFSEVADLLNEPRAPGSGEDALVIDGSALKVLLDKEELCARLLETSLVCHSVICCRVSPLQKALVVEMVRRGRDVVTLAIGDGANDVSMIQAANIGVGISGQEGVQASMAADYAFAQFRYLGKLLLVHGHWDYERISEMILNFFYKNIVWVFAPFWFQIFCGFSANIFYDYTYVSLFNLIFTVAPVCVLGATDQTVTAPYALKYPIIYGVGIRRELYTRLRFWVYFFDGIWQSAVIYFSFHLAYGDMNNEIDFFSTSIALTIVVIVNLVNALNTYYWSWWVFVFVPLEIALGFAWVLVYSSFQYSATLYGIGVSVVSDLRFWFAFIVAIVAGILPRYAIQYVCEWLLASDLHIVRQIEHREKVEKKKIEGKRRWKSKNRDGDVESLNALAPGWDPSLSLDRSRSHRREGSEVETIEMRLR